MVNNVKYAVSDARLFIGAAISGGIAGFLTWIFSRILAEPLIQHAIEYEEGRGEAEEALKKAAGEATGGGDEIELFSRTVQRNIGLCIALIGIGIAFALVIAICYRIYTNRVQHQADPKAVIMVIALIGFLAIYLVPFIKYPANPPAIGAPETIKIRGGLYLLTVLCSVVLVLVAIWARKRLIPVMGTWWATVAVIVGFLIVMTIIFVMLPNLGHIGDHSGKANSETPLPLKDGEKIVYPGFPADVLSGFRIYSVIAQVMIWGITGLLLGFVVSAKTKSVAGKNDK